MVKFSIVIPNWNGKHLLEKNLPAVLVTGAEEVIVVDNGSTDGSREYVRWQMANGKWQMAKIKGIFNKTNLGFATACNQGVEKAKGKAVVLLNNDVVPRKDFLKPLLPHFRNKDIFAVSCHEPQFSWAKGEWVRGFIEHGSGRKVKKAHISFWASGGSAAFSRSKWQIMGGFDTIYDPFYWEDVDLSYRAWKRGWRILWEPKSMVLHKHEATISRFSKTYIDFISQRNQLLFIWKNITSPKMMLEHKFWLGKRLLATPGYWKPFSAALVKRPPILLRQFKEFRKEKVSDEKIFAQFHEDERVLS
jgi:GT2 family glycosyltransferase